MSHWSDPAVVVAVVGAAAAIFYTILTLLIWRATWQNTRATREIIEANQRPYLGITGIEIVKPQYQMGGVKVATTIANVGTVPSRRVKTDITITYPDGKTDRTNEGAPRLVSLFQGQKSATLITLPPERLPLLSTGGFEVSVTVRYQGMTEKQYATRGAYKYTGPLNGFVVTSGHFE